MLGWHNDSVLSLPEAELRSEYCLTVIVIHHFCTLLDNLDLARDDVDGLQVNQLHKGRIYNQRFSPTKLLRWKSYSASGKFSQEETKLCPQSS